MNQPSQATFVPIVPCDIVENNSNNDHESNIEISEEICSHRDQNLNEAHETIHSIRMSTRTKRPPEYLKDYHCNLNVSKTSSKVKYPLNSVLSYDKLSPFYTSLEGFNKVEFFRSCLRNPHAMVRGYPVGGLYMNPRILAFIVVWQLILRGYNHAVLTEEDMILMYCIMHRVKINWVNVFKEHMVKTRNLVDYCIPYVVLVSKFIEYFGVDLKDELVEIVKPHKEVTVATLHKIGLKKINGDH